MSAVPAQSAHVEVLTAEVRVLAVGNRQITLSVYKQLDQVAVEDIEPWGRVRGGMRPKTFGDDFRKGIELIGRSRDGELARAYVFEPEPITVLPLYHYGEFKDWFRVGPRQGWVRWQEHQETYENLPKPIDNIHVLTRGQYRAIYPVPTYPETVPVDLNLPPGAIEWIGAEAKQDLLRAADEEITAAETDKAQWKRLEELPLIVLAGLK